MIRVVGDRVLVALPPTVDEITTASGLVLAKDPDRFQTPTRGIVMALGEKPRTMDEDALRDYVNEFAYQATLLGERYSPESDKAPDRLRLICDADEMLANIPLRTSPEPFDVEIGDCVIFPRSVGELIHDGEISYVILRESEIIGIVEPL